MMLSYRSGGQANIPPKRNASPRLVYSRVDRCWNEVFCSWEQRITSLEITKQCYDSSCNFITNIPHTFFRYSEFLPGMINWGSCEIYWCINIYHWISQRKPIQYLKFIMPKTTTHLALSEGETTTLLELMLVECFKDKTHY